MEEIIQVQNLKRNFNTFIAINDVSFSVYKGEIFGYIGPNGAGKTTTIRILLGILMPTAGHVKIMGFDPSNEEYSYRRRIAALLEYPGVYNDLSVSDNLRYYADIYRLSNAAAKIDELLAFMKLQSRKDELTGRLSKGMKQKLAIARLLLHDPELLFFDEPTSGLDPIFQKEVRDLIQRLAQQGKTVFLSSHNLPEVQGLCSRIAFLKEGNCLAVDTMESFHERFKNCKKSISFKTREDKEKAYDLLLNKGIINDTSNNLKIDILLNDPIGDAQPEKLLANQGIFFESSEKGTLDLEDVFYILMKE